jgi:apolipoprotein N-acyltransferase
MNSTDPAGRRAALLAALSGGLLALSFPRPDLGVLAFVALVPLLLTLQGVRRGAALQRGYACGAVFFTGLLYWIPRVLVVYGGLPWAAALLVLALLVFYLATYVALFAAITAASWRRFGPLALAAAPVTWVALEIVRGQALTGFPWGLIGYSQHLNLPLLQAAALGGIYAVSLLVAAAGAGIALLLLRPAPRRARPAGALLLALVGAAHAGGFAALSGGGRAEAGLAAIQVAAVQGNVPQDVKWSPGSEARIITDLARLTRRAAEDGARLIVWPESASPFSFRRPVPRGAASGAPIAVAPHGDYLDLVGGMARDLGIALIAGSVDYRVEGNRLEALNSAFSVGPDGTLGPSYDKVHLVPFGEYVPLRRLLFFVDPLARGAIAGFAAGARLEPLPTPAGRAATFICYEAAFPELVRRIAARDADFLVNLTNDAWYGRTSMPYQHLAMAVVRAVENRRYLVRAANTGISAIVDPYGRVTARSRLDESAVVRGAMRPRRDPTPYARAGDLLAWGCAILTALHAAAIRAAGARASTRAP